MALGGKGDSANAAVIGLIVAIGLFAGIFATLLDTSYLDTSSTALADSRVYDSMANRFVDQIVAAGTGWYDGQEAIRCVGGRENPAALTPDSVGTMVAGLPQGQFGLGEEDCGAHVDSNHGRWLSYAKVANLYNAQMDASANGHVDYEEARRSLNLVDSNVGFHLRASPVITDVASLLDGPASTPLNAAYIGDFSQETTSSAGTGVVAHESGATDGAESVLVWVSITNDGSTLAAFAVDLAIPLSAGTIDVTRHTPPLGPGDAWDTSLRLWKTRDWTWSPAVVANPAVEVSIRDQGGVLATDSIPFGSINMAAQRRLDQILIQADQLWTPTGGTGATVTYRGFDGTGSPTRVNDWTVEIRNGADHVVAGPTRLSNNVDSGTYTFSSGIVDTYSVRLIDDRGATEWDRDVVNVLAEAPSPYTPIAEVELGPVSVESAVLPEIALIDEVVGGFDAAAFHEDYAQDGLPFMPTGDVYPDLGAVLDGGFIDAIREDWSTETTLDDVGNLDEYDVIFIGSDVDHAELGSAAFSSAISAWVSAGGTLIVFGSDAQDFGWLDHLAGSGIVTANGELYAVDENHPVLSVPNDLDYFSYEQVSGWSLNSRADRFFTHVLREGPAASDGDLLAVSNGGSFGQGRVVLAGYQPAHLTTEPDADCTFPLPTIHDCEAALFIENVITQSYRQLMLDFGPPIPEESPSGAAHRIVLVDHPDLGDPVVLRLTAYVFPQ